MQLIFLKLPSGEQMFDRENIGNSIVSDFTNRGDKKKWRENKGDATWDS